MLAIDRFICVHRILKRLETFVGIARLAIARLAINRICSLFNSTQTSRSLPQKSLLKSEQLDLVRNFLFPSFLHASSCDLYFISRQFKTESKKTEIKTLTNDYSNKVIARWTKYVPWYKLNSTLSWHRFLEPCSEYLFHVAPSWLNFCAILCTLLCTIVL